MNATFSPYANGVGADSGEPLIARTPVKLRLNVSHRAHPLRINHFGNRS